MRQNEKVLAHVFKVFRCEILFVLGARIGALCPEALRYHYTVKKDVSGGVFSRGVGRWGILVACRRSTARRGERIDILRRRYPPPDGLIYLLIGKIFGCSSRARSLLYCSFVWEVFELLWRKKSIQKVCVGIKKVYFCDRKSAHLYFCRRPAGSEQPL